MKGKSFKFLSLLLVAILVVSSIAVAGIAVNAASAAGDVVYFDNSVTNWSNVNCYMWSDGSGNNGSWPGQAMTNVSGDIWAYNVTGSYDKIIFNNGSTQSDDLIYEGNGKVAKPVSNSNKFAVTWSDYSGDVTLPTSATQATQATQPTQATKPAGGQGSIFLQNDAGWSTPYCYMWNSESDKNAAWPGVKMTDLGEGVFECVLPKSYSSVIFNGGSNSNQTGNLTFPGVNNIYNNKTGQWEPYSAGPVKISSFTTDVKSPSYTTCGIKITATAKSSEGDLTYKFSVNGTVLSDGAASSVVWVPTSAGDYTITVDIKDTAGNESSRSMNFVIKDASTLESAFIKAFSNSLGTNVQIKKNSSVTFTTDAIGGAVGTNLLFYKYVVTEPDGVTNIPYYTLNNKYTFTPSKLGVYTIKAYVQNCMNDTTYQTYRYECVNEINETPDTTLPPVTTPTFTTSPTKPTTAPTKPTTAPTTAPQPTVKPTTQPTTVAQPKLGDVDKDGDIDIIDATLIQKYIAELAVIDTTYADTDKNGSIQVQDATMIQKYICGLVTTF